MADGRNRRGRGRVRRGDVGCLAVAAAQRPVPGIRSAGDHRRAWVGIGAGLAGALAVGLSRSAADDASPLAPRVSWQRDQAFGLAVGLLPVRLLRFLDDARQRDVLRTIGPVYQFRHARLQDRLALQATPKLRQLSALGGIVRQATGSRPVRP